MRQYGESLMRYANRSFFVFSLLILSAAFSATAFGATAANINLPEGQPVILIDDYDEPDVKAKVGRFSFIDGEVQIRRADGSDWEKATLNLPIVEGDEISTASGSRAEVQFDVYTHIRLDENAYLKVVGLKDEGIALSHSLGTISITVSSFDKEKSFFEIDVPQSTIALQKSGTYRIDAGSQGDNEIRIAAIDGGEARVYSETSGFILKNGRSTRVFIDGANAGEWDTADASRSMDDFDSWVSDRSRTVAKSLKDAYYDQYYDKDIYGADELNNYGDWVYKNSYGYVWQPSSSSINRWTDWSPYRYGHWRWLSPFGWTWVNDEPWGWATYHHGRWFYDSGRWYWSPYGYYRYSRSWWSPALVSINIFNNNICWYPLGYHHRYNNYNRRRHNNNNGNYGNNYPGNPGGPPRQTGGIKPIPPSVNVPPMTGGIKVPPRDNIPSTGVVLMDAGDFGTTTKSIKRAPLSLATQVLSVRSDVGTAPNLPTYNTVRGNITREIKTDRPKTVSTASQIKVGAAVRMNDAPMDNELRKTKVFGGRPPLVSPTENTSTPIIRNSGRSTDTRKTGAVVREPIVRQPPVKQTPVEGPIIKSAPVSPKYEQPIRQSPPTRVETPIIKQTPRNDPPIRSSPPVRQSPPPVKQSPPRNNPPVKSAPPVKQSPPPTKRAPLKSPPPSSRKGKDATID